MAIPARVYLPRAPQKAVSRASPDQIGRDRPGQRTGPDAADMAALDAEREKVALLQRNLDDLRRMLPPPDAKPRRWWPW